MCRTEPVLANLAKIRGSLPDESENEAETKDSLDIWRTANQLTGFGTTVVSAFSESTLMYKLLSGVSGSRLAPMMFAMWAVRAMPAFDSDSDRVWSQGKSDLSLNASRSPNLHNRLRFPLREWGLSAYASCQAYSRIL
jgi:hypothetical protein